MSALGKSWRWSTNCSAKKNRPTDRRWKIHLLDWVGEPNAAALVGLMGGVLLGLAARIGRFCTLGADLLPFESANLG